MAIGLEIIGELVELTAADEPPGHTVRQVTTLRESHHAAARMLARGLRDLEVCRLTGYSPGRLAGLRRDPMFSELIGFYRQHEDKEAVEFEERMKLVAADTLASIQDDLLDMPYLPFDKKVEAFKVLADRAGYAPVQRSVNRNFNVSIAERMDAARKRKDVA